MSVHLLSLKLYSWKVSFAISIDVVTNTTIVTFSNEEVEFYVQDTDERSDALLEWCWTSSIMLVDWNRCIDLNKCVLIFEVVLYNF